MNTEAENKASSKTADSIITPQMNIVLSYIEEHGTISDGEIQELLGIKKTRCFNLTKQMIGMELIKSIGRGGNRKFIVF